MGADENAVSWISSLSWIIPSFITLIGTIIGVLIYRDQQRKKRIDGFINNFFNSYTGGGTILRHLIPSGINDLKTNGEIKIALKRLHNRLGHPPLRTWNSDIGKIGYKKFFNRVNNGPSVLNKNTINVFINSWKKN